MDKKDFTFHLLDTLSNQIHLSETRAGLLISVNTVLLTLESAIVGSIWKSLTQNDSMFVLILLVFPISIVLASLFLSLYAILPNPKHGQLKEKYVYSSISKMEETEFLDLIEQSNNTALLNDYWGQIYGISCFLDKKFNRLKNAIWVTVFAVAAWMIILAIVFYLFTTGIINF